jgi:ankyrin repeat protein/beta-lactamase regulating signal transducer with metallopeptidase domain/Tol biopolymer transport system component
METYLTQITDYLLRQSWQIAVLVLVVAAATFALRNRSAHVRYLLWLIVLAKCLVPPLLEVPVAVLPERVSVGAAFTIPLPAAVETMPETTRPLEVAPIVAPVVPSRPQLSPRQWIAIGWLAGVLAFACIAAVKAGRTVRWLRRDRRPLPHDVQTGVNDLLSPFGLRRLPRMWLIEGVGQPFVWGAVRGDIYLPASFVRIPDDGHRKHVLGHELGHVMRFDAAVNLVQIIAQSVFWFHPLVWWANRRIRAEREKCCDEMAIARLNAQAKDYTRAIVETLVTEYESTRPVPSLAIAGPVRNIEERIKIMLRPGKKFNKHASLPAVAVVVFTALLAVPTTVVLIASADEAPIFGNSTNLGPEVNSSVAEYDPHISPDGLSLYFLSQQPGGLGDADIWVTARKTKDEPWGQSVNLGQPVNSSSFEGGPCISADGLEMYFVSDRPGGSGSIDIWVTKRETKDSPWGPPVSLGSTVNSAAAENGPSISIDGLELYFSEAIWSSPPPRPGGMGRADIWVTTRKTKNDPWGTPVNLGPTVNGPYSDCTPSISTEGLSLYFHSTRPGYGESDIWVTTRKTKNDPWGAPINLGPTVNTSRIECNPDISSDGSTLHFASNRPGSVDIWQVSSKANAKVAKSLYHAAATGDIEQVQVRISRGSDVNEKTTTGDTALHSAAKHDHKDVAELLIKEGADVNAKNKRGDTPAHVALKEDHKELLDLLIAKGAKLSCIQLSAYQGDLAKVRSFVKQGTKVDTMDSDGATALHYAAMRGNKDMVEFLLSGDANVNAKDKHYGFIPLHRAAAAGHRDLVELFIAKGADVNAKDNWAWTPLHYACQKNHKDTVALLLARGADLNAGEEEGETPLGVAKERGHSEIVELLRKHGAKE